MRRGPRRLIVFVAAIAMAFAGLAGPRHAQAGMHGAAMIHAHGGQGHSGEHHSHAGVDAAVMQHDDGSRAIADLAGQNCCVAWCSSVAFFHGAPSCPLPPQMRSDFNATNMRMLLAALPALIDPPPR